MKKFLRMILILLACLFIVPKSFADEWDISTYSLDELKVIQEQITQRIQELEIQEALENGDRQIFFDESDPLLYVNQKRQLKVSVLRRTENAPKTTTLVWETDDPAVAKVNNGWITPLTPGQVVITVKAKDDERIQASIRVKVVFSVSSLTLEQNKIELILGADSSLSTAALSAQIHPSDAFHQEIIWTSSNEQVVAVDQDGILRAVSAGRAVITAQTNDPSLTQQKKASCAVTVYQAATEIDLSENALELGVRDTKRLSASILPESVSSKGVAWESSNPAVASVSTAGVVTGVSPGECTIICTAADGYGASAVCTVTVTRLITKISDASANDGIVGMSVDGEITITVRVEPEDATNQQLRWSVSDESIAEIIHSDGRTVVLRGKARGQTALTGEAADSSGKSIVYPVAVEDDFSLECTGNVETGISYGYRWFALECLNTSVSRTVDGVTIRYYAENVYGEKIQSYGIGDEDVENTFNLTIAPGQIKTMPQEIIYGFNQAKTMYAAIVKLHYTNGETAEVEGSEYVRFELPE